MKRYEVLLEDVECQEELTTLREHINTYEKIVLRELSGETSGILSKLTETYNHILDIQSQWFYNKGMDDGRRLHKFLTHNREFFIEHPHWERNCKT